MQDRACVGESMFWEFLGERLREHEDELQPLYTALGKRASALNLPVTFGGPRSDAWAFVCRLFRCYQERMYLMGRREYGAMTAGAKRLVNRRFATEAFRRIAANIAYPSSPDRTMEQSVADTFLANGLVVTGRYEGPAADGAILAAMLGDGETEDLCRRAVTPPRGVWEKTLADYPLRRPGPLARMVLDWYLRFLSR